MLLRSILNTNNIQFVSIAILLLPLTAIGQNTLKMGALGGSLGNGPTTNTQTVTLYKNGTTTYTPTTTVTYTLSNQQFPAGTVEGLPETGLTFGAFSNLNNNSPMGSLPIYDNLNSLSSPTNAMFSGCATCGANNGIDVTTDKAVSFYACSDALIDAATNNLYNLNSRVYYGDLTLTFNYPISNPVIHVVGLGGFVVTTINNKIYYQGLSAEFDLVGSNVSLSKLDGNNYLDVTSNQITNTATYKGSSSLGTTTYGVTRFAATGSVLASGTNITSITFKVYLKGDGGRISNTFGSVVSGDFGLTPVWSTGSSNPVSSSGMVSGDVFLIGVSFEEPLDEICNSGIDEDGDGLIDCADSDCQPIISNINTTQPTCSNKTNGEIIITATGSGVLSYSIANEPNWQASNTFSNLGIGQYAIRVRNDSGCETTYTNNPIILDFETCVEICDDGIDNDGDGKVDCDDPNCKNVGTVNDINRN